MNYFCRYFSSNTVQYHGLVNQGATCYLNSVLQALFMTKDFREAVQRHTCENPDTDCIDRHLATLFGDLKEQKAYTHNITRKLGIKRVGEQRDAAEYFEKILNLTSPDASQIFHGLSTHKTICSACCKEAGTDGPFWHLPLALVHSNSEDYSVVNGIEEYFRASYLSGENQMYCDQCDAKSDATIKCVITKHPEVLMLLLKRFEFDYSYMTYVKNNCSVDVPCTLQIPENQTYELYAVVEHFGDLRCGHYTVTIKSQDDERWYSFNDDWVTLLDHQPVQQDNFMKSGSPYLLFYRKNNVHAADTCTQDLREVSPPGGFPPATSNIYDERHEAGKMREREEVEEAAEAGNDTAVDVSIETGIGDMKCRGVGLPMEDQDNGVYARQIIPYNHHENNVKIITDEEDMRGNAEADDQAEKRENISREPEESVEDQDDDSGRQDDVRQNRPQEGLEGDDIHNTSCNDHNHKQEVSNMHARQEYSEQVCVDMQREEEKMVMDVKMAGDEQSERRRKASTEYLNRDAEHQDNEGLADVRQDMNEDQQSTQKTGQDYDLMPVSVDKQGDEERMKIDVKVDVEGKAGADEQASGGGKRLTVYQLSYHESQVNGRVGDSRQNMPKDDQRSKQGSSSRYEGHEEQREARSDVKGDKEQKRGDAKHEQRKGTSERQHIGQDVEDQNNGGLDDIGPNQSEQNIIDVGVVKQAKEQENKREEHIQNSADSSPRQAGLAGSRRPTENQGVGSVEKTRQRDSQPKARTEFKEDTMEGRRGPEQSRPCQVKITEVEFKDGIQRSSETKYIGKQTVQKTSQDIVKSEVENNEGNAKRKSDAKTDAMVRLPDSVRNLTLSESTLQEPQKHRAKRVNENETNSATYSNHKKKPKFSDTQEQTTEMKHATEKRPKTKNKLKLRFDSWRTHRKEKSKQNKTTGCFF
ncbi:uncharacterized protein [Enoplosus armatus]|uniref:uncharacterized protein n=1 Tax=Enoplosus armatus TaxID=215367 RepID=UPI003994F355